MCLCVNSVYWLLWDTTQQKSCILNRDRTSNHQNFIYRSMLCTTPHVISHAYVTRHTPHATRHTPHATHHRPHVISHTSHAARSTPRHTPHITPHTSHATHHTCSAESKRFPNNGHMTCEDIEALQVVAWFY